MQIVARRRVDSKAAAWPGVAAALVVVAMMAGCASGPSSSNAPPRSYPSGRDGPEAHPPPDLDKVPDAEPKIETVRPGGANKPYEQSGKVYVPLAGDPPYRERGLASWYGRKFHGQRTSSGELYNMYGMTAAHPTLPIPSYIRVRNPANGREVIVRVNDRGPFHSDRIIDLSYTAALRLDLLRGVATVEIERITYDDIRTGAWKRSDPDATLLAVAPAPVVVTTRPVPPSVASAIVAASPAGAMAAAAADSPAVASLPATGAGMRTASTQPSSAASAPVGTAPLVGLPDPVAVAATEPDPVDASALAADVPAPAITDGARDRAFTKAARGYWVQLGAFSQSAGAVQLQRQVAAEMEALAPLLAIFSDPKVHRLQAGPYRSRAEAASAADNIRIVLKLVPVIVERR